MQFFYEPEYEGNLTEFLNYHCNACGDTGFIVDFYGHSTKCPRCSEAHKEAK